MHKTLIDFIIAEADERPYFEISILRHTLLGLLEFGASMTIVEEAGLTGLFLMISLVPVLIMFKVL